MVALLDVDDIEDAIGRAPANATEEAQWQFYIDAISSFINSYVDVTFELLEGDVVRFESDYYGVIDLGLDPIVAVNSVSSFGTSTGVSYYWNGLSEIRGLHPNVVVDVDYDHGYETVPDDIKFLATQAVVGILGLSSATTGALTSYKVGDVTEVYSDSGDAGNIVVQLQRSTLDNYSATVTSWRLGSNYNTGGNTLPTL